MSKCDRHPGRDATESFFGKQYCAKCAEQIKRAQSQIDRHVTPRNCFVTYYDNATGWIIPEGTGCAHWVAHEKGIKNGHRGDKCALEYSFKIPDVISGARKIDREKEDVKVGDIWAVTKNTRYPHCGLVVKIETVKIEDGGEKQKITIRHCSSGQGKVVNNDFATYLKGKGDFYRK